MCAHDTPTPPQARVSSSGHIYGERQNHTASGSARLLDRLDRAMQTGDRQWRARCPAHEAQSRALSVRETDDGRTLIHCFAGCSALDVLASVGLRMQDLFPERPADHRYPPTRSRMPAAEALALTDHEATVAALILRDVVATGSFDGDQLQRLTLAAERISSARNLSCPARPAREVTYGRS